MDKKVIIFNGPPSSGKDTAATRTANYLNGRHAVGGLIPFRPAHYKFADPLKAAVHQLLAVPFSCAHYEKEFGNEWKDQPQKEFYGRTPREAYIGISETFAKPLFGDGVFGRVLARRFRMDKQSNVAVVSDGGFIDELVPVVLEFGADNVLVVRVTRPGCSFVGDSRSYLDVGSHLVTKKVKSVELPNPADLELFRVLTQGVVKNWLKVEEEG